MKSIGIKNLQIILALLLLVISVQSVAQNYPRAASNCSLPVDVLEPQGSSGYLLSQDCKVVYVLPPVLGKVRAASFAPNTNLKYCSQMIKLHDQMVDLQKQIDLNIQRGETSRQPGIAEATQKTIRSLQKLKTERTNDFNQLAILEGGSVQFLFTLDWSFLLNEYKRLNNASGLTFTRSPISKSSIDYEEKSWSEDTVRSAHVLKVITNLPGTGGSRAYNMGSAFSGYGTFTLHGLCPFVNSTNPLELDLRNGAGLMAHLAVIANYSTPQLVETPQPGGGTVDTVIDNPGSTPFVYEY